MRGRIRAANVLSDQTAGDVYDDALALIEDLDPDTTPAAASARDLIFTHIVSEMAVDE